MATFVAKENPVRSANAGFMPTSVHAVFFLDSLTQTALQERNHRSRAFCAQWTLATPVNADALKVGTEVDDSQSVVLRDRGGMAATVLTLQQCWMVRPGGNSIDRAI
jgi:hypothetical protein